ncbi:MAG: CIA30 family protein [Erythrobacter sp.]|nr:CIA30 family protein [Erythrobacter sp.]
MPLLTPALALGLALSASASVSQPVICRPFIDFSSTEEFSRWRVVNDGVMGGLSSGAMRFEDGRVTYAGAINTNGGGFSSIRRPVARGTLAKAVALRVTHESDGRAYKLSLRSSARYRGRPISFQAPIAAQSDTAIVRFDDLRASFRGYSMGNVPFDRAAVDEIGLILADGRDGPFEMSMQTIEICERAV